MVVRFFGKLLSSVKRSSCVGSWGRSGVCGSAATSDVSGATKRAGAAATAGGGKGTGAAANPTGTGAGAIGKRILTVTGGGPSVTFLVATPIVGGANKEGILSSNNVGSPQKKVQRRISWNSSEFFHDKVVAKSLMIYLQSSIAS